MFAEPSSRRGGTCGAGLRRAGKGWKPGLCVPDLWAHQTHPESAGGVALEAPQPSPALLGEVQNPGVYSPPDQGHGPQALILPACPAPSPHAPGRPLFRLKPGVQRQGCGAQTLWPACLSHPRCLRRIAEKVHRPAPQLSHSLLTPEPQGRGKGSLSSRVCPWKASEAQTCGRSGMGGFALWR